jgi:hypothetical protein
VGFENTAVGVSLHQPEDGNRSSFRNVVFSSYLEFRTVDEAQKLSCFVLYIFCLKSKFGLIQALLHDINQLFPYGM